LASLAQRVTANNIANVDTPGYRTRGFDFRSEFQRFLADPKLPAQPPPRVETLGGLPVKNDGNDVQLERELRNLGENAIRFQHALLMLRDSIRSIRSAIQEGGRG
jgi:flagellar basal-body rod protein FlgB